MISWPASDFSIDFWPVSVLLTITWLNDTYVNSNFPLYFAFLRQTSKTSTDPHKEPKPIFEESGLKATAVTE